MWPSLEAASRVSDISNFFFIGSLVVGVISTILIVWMVNVKEGYWEKDRRESAERIKGAEERTEELRAANLALEELVSPRMIEFPTTAAALKPFSGTMFVVESVPDFEARRTAAQIEAVLLHAGWKKFEASAESPLPPLRPAYRSGVTIEPGLENGFPPGLGPTFRVAGVLQRALQQNHVAAGIVPEGKMPSNTLRIFVELKPIPMELLKKRMEQMPADSRGNRAFGAFPSETAPAPAPPIIK